MKLNPALIQRTHQEYAKSEDWPNPPNKPGSLGAPDQIISALKSSPTIYNLLNEAGILEKWACLMFDQIKAIFWKAPNPREARSQAMMDLLPVTEEKEAEWLAINTHSTPQAEATTT
jgi:hypothetical protein